MNTNLDRLYELLPAVYRQRDAEHRRARRLVAQGRQEVLRHRPGRQLHRRAHLRRHRPRHLLGPLVRPLRHPRQLGRGEGGWGGKVVVHRLRGRGCGAGGLGLGGRQQPAGQVAVVSPGGRH